MKYSSWNISQYNEDNVKQMVDEGIPVIAAAVLSARGYDTPGEALTFINQGLEQLNDPNLLPDMDKAVARVRRAFDEGETIAIYGDYDVDGITSLALLARTFKDHGVECVGYIPDRVEEGYGMNIQAVDYLAAQGVKLIITVDCGITAVEEVAYAKSLGIGVIITDHHECKDVLPDAEAVVNPRRNDCDYPFKTFAGIGVAYKFLCAVFEEYRQWEMLSKYSPLVAIGTVADVMPIINENRVVVRMGLQHAKDSQIVGLRKLMEACGLKGKEPTSAQVSYVLAPKLNAAGRMGKVRLATDLLITEDEQEADRVVAELMQLNRERQKLENDILREAEEMLREKGNDGGVPIVLAREGWHQGVIGIVASRAAEKYKAPAFMISMTGDVGKASCRSYGGFNLFKALEQTADLLETYGGHALAAGFSIKRENIPEFERRIGGIYAAGADTAEPGDVLDVDLELKDPAVLSVHNVLGLAELEPFGTGNPLPVICVKNMTVDAVSDVGGGRHMKLTLTKNGKYYDAIFFSANSWKMGIVSGDEVDAAFTPDINEFRGHKKVQFQMKDIRQSERTRHAEQEEFEIYDRFTAGEEITPGEAQRLLPERGYFVGAWRYLKTHTRGELRGERGYVSRCVAQVAAKQASAMRTMICLDSFAELGLVELKKNRNEVYVRVLEDIDGKVDLNQAPTVLRLNAIIKG